MPPVTSRLLPWLLSLALLAAGTSAAGAHAYTQGDITVDHPYATATMPGMKTGAAYLTIVNKGKAAVRLKSASTPVAASVEFHDMWMDGNVMRMRSLGDGVTVPAGGKVSFAPGGAHMMLIGLTRPLADKDRISLVLAFEGLPDMQVEIVVKAPVQGGHHMH